nr:MmcQ/YjbR family DNA-binding protein [Anaeromicropila herbilytica]
MPTYAALRHEDNQKIYCLFMDVPRKKLGVAGDTEEYADIINLKCDPDMKMMIAGQHGILPSYHMKAGNWITMNAKY